MTLEDRIVRLERQNRWMKHVGGVAVVLVVLFLTLGQSKLQDTIRASTVEAQEFRLVDERGKVKSRWKALDGRAGLFFRNPKGKIAIFLGTANEDDVVGNLILDGSIRSKSYSVDDKDGFTRSTWGVQDGVGVHLVLYDANKNASLVLSGRDNGDASMLMGADVFRQIGADAKVPVRLNVPFVSLMSNPPGLLVTNKNGGAVLTVMETGPHLQLQDRTDTTVFKAP